FFDHFEEVRTDLLDNPRIQMLGKRLSLFFSPHYRQRNITFYGLGDRSQTTLANQNQVSVRFTRHYLFTFLTDTKIQFYEHLAFGSFKRLGQTRQSNYRNNAVQRNSLLGELPRISLPRQGFV